MIKEYKNKANLFIAIGFVAQLIGRFMLNGSASWLGALLTLGGAVLLILGCCNYAKGKGYHWAFGFLGLLSLLGLIILVIMKDKCKEEK